MFTGFASENTPAIKVWNFYNTFGSIGSPRSVSLPDDCSPIQVFKTGATTTAIDVYLPASAPEGKQITIVNSRFGGSNQSLSIRSSDVSGSGAASGLYTLGPGGYLVLTYSKDFISFGTTSGGNASGWISLNYSNQTAANYGSIAIGDANSASGVLSSAVGGNGNIASGIYSTVVGGGSNTASTTYSGVYAGNSNTANNTSATVIGGAYGTTRSITGNFVTPASNAPIVGSAGFSQLATLLLGRETINATATRLTSNTSAASTTNQVILPNNSAYTFQGTCIANVTGGGTTSGWKFEGVIKRGANAASTALVAAVTPTVIAQDVAAATWVLAITADTTNGGIAVTVTGAAATTIRWVAKIDTTEVTF